MHLPSPRKSLLLAPLALAMALAGCGKGPVAAPGGEASASPSAAAIGPTAAPGIAIGDAVIRLPLASGNPGVAYFTLTQAAGAPRKLVGIDVAGVGRAEMHESKGGSAAMSMAPVREVAIEPGKSVTFAPGGYHVMLFDLDPSVKAGTTRELTATFDNGDKATVKARVESGIDNKGGGAMDHAGHM